MQALIERLLNKWALKSKTILYEYLREILYFYIKLATYKNSLKLDEILWNWMHDSYEKLQNSKYNTGTYVAVQERL